MSSAVFQPIYASRHSTSAGFDSAWGSIANCCVHKDKYEASPQWGNQLFLMDPKWTEREQQAADAALKRYDRTMTQTTSMIALTPAPSVMPQARMRASYRTEQTISMRTFLAKAGEQTLLRASGRTSEASAELHKQPGLLKPSWSDALQQAVDSQATTGQAYVHTASFSGSKPAALVTAKVEEHALSTVAVATSLGMTEPHQEPEPGYSARSIGNTAGTSFATPQKVVRQARNRRFSHAELKPTIATAQLPQQWLGA